MTDKICHTLGMAFVDEIANDGRRNAAGGIYATSVQEFATEIQRNFAQSNGLLVPGMTIELLLNDDLHALVEAFAKASDEGRRTILRLAEAEVRYAEAPTKPLFSKAAADGSI